jgi:arginine-tRNA-protein transferase
MLKSSLDGQNIVEFSTLESRCVYLHDRNMKMHYKYIKNSSLETNSNLVKRGWRRFGHYFSRPQCNECKECLSIKIDVKKFELTRSKRRVYKKNLKTRYIIQNPTNSIEHMELYKKFHMYMREKKGWEYFSISANSYEELYTNGHSFFGKEVLYFYDQKLIGVDLIDFLEDGISSIYFFYDPSYAHLSLGRYSLYKQIDFAKQRELDWIYLGYGVKDCSSLNYKFDYKPYKILRNNPNLNQKPIWV